MEHTTSLQNAASLQVPVSIKNHVQTGVFQSYFSWVKRQDEKKFLWLAIAIVASIGMVLPITLFSIVNSGNNFNLWIIACTVNVPVLALNLAAQPPRITIHFLLFAWLIDLLLIAYCASMIFLK